MLSTVDGHKRDGALAHAKHLYQLVGRFVDKFYPPLVGQSRQMPTEQLGPRAVHRSVLALPTQLGRHQNQIHVVGFHVTAKLAQR